jgi:hypothetical protein
LSFVHACEREATISAAGGLSLNLIAMATLHPAG